MSASMHYLAGHLAERKDGDEWADAFRQVISWEFRLGQEYSTGAEFLAAMSLAETVLNFMRSDAGKNLPSVRAWAAERERWAWQRDLLREELRRCLPIKPGARKEAIEYALEQTAKRPDEKEPRT